MMKYLFLKSPAPFFFINLWKLLLLSALFFIPQAFACDCGPDPGLSGSNRSGTCPDGLEGKEKVNFLICRGETYRTQGRLGDAVADFHTAMDIAEREQLSVLKILAEQSLGYLYFLQQKPDRGEPLLRSALDDAKALDHPLLIATCANRLGGVLFNKHQIKAAKEIYELGLESARTSGDAGLVAAIHRNLAQTTADAGKAMEHLVAARTAAHTIESSGERAGMLSAIAAQVKTKGGGKYVSFIYSLLRDAYLTAMQIKTPAYDTDSDQGHSDQDFQTIRLQSIAAGEFGALYESEHRLDEAYQLTVQALSKAQLIQSHDLLLRWEWQLGRLHKARNHLDQAIAALRRAVNHIEAIRNDIPIKYANGKSSFRETLAPIYLDLADLLLKFSEIGDDDSHSQQMLREARDTVERIKQSELQDYFQDRCVASRSRTIDSVAAGTAIVYPVVLPQRLELLVDLGGHLHRQTVEVTQKELENTAAKLAQNLRKLAFYKTPAKQLHTWLIEPLSDFLKRHRVDTLVFVPDGALRLVPMAALWDGNTYLVERFAVVTTPGLTLLDPDPLPRENMEVLIAGMSEPGPVIEALEPPLYEALRSAVCQHHGMAPLHSNSDGFIARRGIAIVNEDFGLQKTGQPHPGPIKSQRLKTPEDIAQIKEKLALPGVKAEIAALSELLQGRVLFNESFRFAPFSTEIETRPFRVIHIASHGYFGGTPERNFIMTYDKPLNMNDLETLVKPKQFADQPVEMITLSACQTAEGDDRSPLGLSGVALKSGARSALGTLWPVSDHAAQTLLPEFYKQLKDPSKTKAQALRCAQRHLMQKDGFDHPFFWSPFILVGNWL